MQARRVSIPTRRSAVLACAARTSAWLQSPRAMASSDRSLSASASMLCASTSSAALTASSRYTSAPSRSPERMRAIAWQSWATGATMFAAASFCAASSASACISPTPRRHKTARRPAAHASVGRSKGCAASWYCQRSTMAAQRSASAGRPMSMATYAAHMAIMGCAAIPSRSSSHWYHRWRVVSRPCRWVGGARARTRLAAVSTSPAAMEYSSASSRRSLRRHQPAARRRSTGIRPGSRRSSSASSMSRNR